jgi:predicted Rossmann fold flavoprotein
MIYDLVVIGAGAGGCFSAIRLAELKPGSKILILEAARRPLSKVEISGGGRCNVTHACFDPEVLINYYPRGGKELLKPFKVFQPKDLVAWFKAKGVKLKAEQDGRMFPESDSSSTIISCFQNAMKKSGIEMLTSTRAVEWEKEKESRLWKIKLMDGQIHIAKNLLISSGSDQRTWDFLKKEGHTIINPVPSLFTFQVKDKTITTLSGISRPEVQVSIPEFNLTSSGPLLITHWGFSGPAVLKLSAWGARELYKCGYTFDFSINWANEESNVLKTKLKTLFQKETKKKVQSFSINDIPSRLWKYLCSRAGVLEQTNGSEMGNVLTDKLAQVLTADIYRIVGKSTFKEEFVTAGGVDLNEIDFQKFESKLIPGLFLVGEVLNIDALTGGYNFQAAWTGAEIAAQSIGRY